ncbi:hypothetical protein ZWY2020_032887 [Hordeum vulgare]|nr:hypothetical protein ZWY2020_032887 [Hordeum vulgare]
MTNGALVVACVATVPALGVESGPDIEARDDVLPAIVLPDKCVLPVIGSAPAVVVAAVVNSVAENKFVGLIQSAVHASLSGIRCELATVANLVSLPHTLRVQAFIYSLLVCPEARSSIKLPIVSWNDFIKSVHVAHDIYKSRVDPATIAKPCNVHYSGVKRKTTEVPASSKPDFAACLSLDSEVSQIANETIPYIVSDAAKPDLRSNWIEMEGHPRVRVTGQMFCAAARFVVEIGRDLCDGAIRMLNDVERAKYVADPSKPPRLYLCVSFVVAAVGIENSEIPIADMLSPDVLGYDVRACREIVVVVPVRDTFNN